MFYRKWPSDTGPQLSPLRTLDSIEFLQDSIDFLNDSIDFLEDSIVLLEDSTDVLKGKTHERRAATLLNSLRQDHKDESTIPALA